MKTLRIEEMTWQEIKVAMEQGYRRVIFALGSIEQHGPHLPLVTDTLLGDVLAVRVAEKLGSTLVAPTIRPGCSEHHLSFPGSLSISSDLLAALARAYCHSLANQGFQAIILLPSHGGNFATVKRILPELETEIPAKVVGYFDLVEFTRVQDAIAYKYGVSAGESGAHAGCSETSLVLNERPDLVHMDQAQAGFVGDFLALAQNIPSSSAGFAIKWENFSPLGVLGDPRPASVELGRDLLEGLADHLAAFYRIALG
ncbi:MAG: creatininase family protein [Chloroflexi bacterium]|nr:creatininase family protein [Chloroflexota bacterium]